MDYRANFLLQFLYTQDLVKDDVDISESLRKYDDGDVLQLQDLIGHQTKDEAINHWNTRAT